MNPILSWLRDLFVETPPLATDASGPGLTACLVVGPVPRTPPDRSADLILNAPDGYQAAKMLSHLARLGTIGWTIVMGSRQLPLSEKRHLSRVARQQRREGLYVTFLDESAA